MNRPHLLSGGRYPVLRALAILYLCCGALIVLSGLIGTAWALFAAPWDLLNRIVLALLVLAATFIATVTVVAIAEGIKLAIDLEHHTRLTALRGALPKDDVKGEVVGGRLGELCAETAEEALIKGH